MSSYKDLIRLNGSFAPGSLSSSLPKTKQGDQVTSTSSTRAQAGSLPDNTHDRNGDNNGNTDDHNSSNKGNNNKKPDQAVPRGRDMAQDLQGIGCWADKRST
ncbi:hypothetical protein McanMca71_003080 [Microsporum canis]